MKTTIEFEIEYPKGDDYEYITVDVEVEGSYGNHGIGSYEYWGFKGNDVQMGWEIDDWSWDKTKYTDEENQIIEKYLIDNDNDVYKEFEKKVTDY